MNSGERKVLAMIAHVLVKKIGVGSGGSFSGGLKTVVQEGELISESGSIVYRVRTISWSSIDVYDETNSLKTYNTRIMAKNDIVIRTQERESYDLSITYITSSLVEGEMDGYRFSIEFPSWDDVLIRDSAYSSHPFLYTIKPA